MPNGLINVLLYVPVFLFSLCFHEFAHAWVANLLGDDTAEREGRLTMHPMAHADVFGTLLLPIICIYNGWPFFGWAKPVPVDSRNLKKAKRDMALVSAAGPAANVLLALIATGGLAILARLTIDTPLFRETLPEFAVIAIQVNIMLTLFNLIPIPPLDGFAILQGFLPRDLAERSMVLHQYANFLLIALLLTGAVNIFLAPASTAYRYLIRAALPQ